MLTNQSTKWIGYRGINIPLFSLLLMFTPLQKFHYTMQICYKSIFRLIAILGFASPYVVNAQNAGDTIRVKTFHYGTNNRDTIANFPDGKLEYEKIILRYAMRCKNGLISDGSNRNKGCGEWDYSCNTFLVDSSKVEVIPQTAAKFVVSNFTGSQFSHTAKPVYDYYDYTVKKVSVTAKTNTSQYTVGTASNNVYEAINTAQKSGKTQILYRAQELLDAGFSAGDIQGIALKALTEGKANFLKIRLQHTSLNKLDAALPVVSGFTETYYNSTDFVVGSNEIIFHTPFAWDGMSNLLFEYSFTNASPASGVVLGGFSDTAVSMLSANNNYAVDLSSNGQITLAADSFSTIKNELSIAFWAKGDANALPTNTSVIYGWNTDPNQRQLNIHFPWSDGNVYFDCGYAAGGFDRINKAATPAEYEGNWNHWVFTKNSSTGNMSIYVNGTLWLSGSSKTKAMAFKNLILGTDQNGNNNYKGKINQLSIWNKALTASEVKDWMNKNIDPSHPKYANLVGYYPFQEGSGNAFGNTQTVKPSTGKNTAWTYDRGDVLNRNFVGSSSKPQLTVLTGSYTRSVTDFEQRDSIVRAANVINRYVVEDKSGAGIVTHDLLKIDSSFSLYEARKSMVYKGETGVLIDSIAVKSEGLLDLVKLNYSLRFPWYNELVSFVTPYGINLDLGMAGKSWYFDLTDFAPLLKNKKRLMVAMGGQNQEQMEMEFLFIVGKPVRPVLSMNQLWQGGARIGGPGINSILNNNVFAPVDVPLSASAKSFKTRSTITGHGSYGEFEQNGGPITHTLNVSGNAMSWNSVMDCSINPMIAQGGTWLIPRQGWCPGWRSKLMEYEITKFVSPGKTETIDYEISQPTKSGDYRYIVAHQLVEYGDMNFNTDVRILEVLKPTKDYEFSKSNPMCSEPTVLVQNTGKSAVKTIKFTYWMNDATVKQSWHWAGNLASLDTASIVLPTWELWAHGMLAANNVFHCEVTEVNGVADEYAQNSKMRSAVAVPDVLPGNFKIEIRTNNFPMENAFKLLDADGKVVVKDSFTVANKVYTYTLNLNGCYKLMFYDYGLDGLSWWANTAQGTGAARLRNATTNAILKTFILDFGSYFEYSFTTNYALRSKNLGLGDAVNLYPNPASGRFGLQGEMLNGASVVVMDLMGKVVISEQLMHDNQATFNTEGWSKGVYTVVISKGDDRATKKVIVY